MTQDIWKKTKLDGCDTLYFSADALAAVASTLAKVMGEFFAFNALAALDHSGANVLQWPHLLPCIDKSVAKNGSNLSVDRMMMKRIAKMIADANKK